MKDDKFIDGAKFILALVFLIAIGIFMQCNAQSTISISIHQDLKLATIGDTKRGYEAFTPNLLIRFKMQGKQRQLGYMVVFPEFEYAEIDGYYKRYSANAGYTFNQWFEKWEYSIYGSYGFIDRWSKSFFSFGASGEIAYKISDKFKVSAVGQFTERKDLKWAWNDNAIRFSGFIGVEYNIK